MRESQGRETSITEAWPLFSRSRPSPNVRQDRTHQHKAGKRPRTIHPRFVREAVKQTSLIRDVAVDVEVAGEEDAHFREADLKLHPNQARDEVPNPQTRGKRVPDFPSPHNLTG